MHQCRLGDDLLEMKSLEKNLRILVENRLAVNQQCALMAKKVNGILEYIKNSAASRLQELILPRYSLLVKKCSEHCDQFWAPHSRKIGIS